MFGDFFFFFNVEKCFKVLTEFVTTLPLFYVLVFWLRGTWDPSSPIRDRTCTPALEGEISTTLNHQGSPWRHFQLSQLGGTGIQWVGTRDAARHPGMHRTAPTGKDAQTQM